MSPKVCVECGDTNPRYWGSHFCEKCFRKVLRDHLKEKKNERKSND